MTRVSIITPSFRQPDWLRLCLASVADQHGVEVEHIVQDNCSGSEVRQVVGEFPHARLYEEADTGMYDAVNRGLERSTGDICAYLNCDEQYLPGALEKVAAHFETHPDVEVVFGDVVITDAAGEYLCSRQVIKPLPGHTRFCPMNTLTAGTFFRRSIVERGFLFDTQWRVVGDAAWMLRLLQAGVRMDVMRMYTSVFTETGSNTGRSPATREEELRLQKGAPAWQRYLTHGYALHHRLRRWRHGLYRPKPFSYDVYTLAEPDRRSMQNIEKPTFFWPGRFELAG
jgi:glycosyltransferase involved in cell wall biosynthesis